MAWEMEESATLRIKAWFVNKGIFMHRKSAVVDKISGSWATLLEGRQEKKVIIHASDLPSGVKEGSWLHIEADGTLTLDPEKTRQRQERVRQKLDRLRGG